MRSHWLCSGTHHFVVVPIQARRNSLRYIWNFCQPARWLANRMRYRSHNKISTGSGEFGSALLLIIDIYMEITLPPALLLGQTCCLNCPNNVP
jgi:hypothetical protein